MKLRVQSSKPGSEPSGFRKSSEFLKQLRKNKLGLNSPKTNAVLLSFRCFVVADDSVLVWNVRARITHHTASQPIFSQLLSQIICCYPSVEGRTQRGGGTAGLHPLPKCKLKDTGFVHTVMSKVTLQPKSATVIG